MSREEKITKVKKIISDFYGCNFQRPISAVAKDIVYVIEEEEPEEQFFKNEIVMCPHITTTEGRYSLYKSHIGTVERLPVKVLAATVGARIEGAKWWSIDAEGLMDWWREEPAWWEETSTREMSGWVSGGCLAEIQTTIRQEPEKGEL
jgi:hypothetical protein